MTDESLWRDTLSYPAKYFHDWDGTLKLYVQQLCFEYQCIHDTFVVSLPLPSELICLTWEYNRCSSGTLRYLNGPYGEQMKQVDFFQSRFVSKIGSHVVVAHHDSWQYTNWGWETRYQKENCSGYNELEDFTAKSGNAVQFLNLIKLSKEETEELASVGQLIKRCELESTHPYPDTVCTTLFFQKQQHKQQHKRKRQFPDHRSVLQLVRPTFTSGVVLLIEPWRDGDGNVHHGVSITYFKKKEWIDFVQSMEHYVKSRQ